MCQPPRITFSLHTNKVQSQPWTHTLDVCKSTVDFPSPILKIQLFQSSIFPKTMTHGIIRSCQLNFPKIFLVELNHYSSIPSDSFSQERKLAEKKEEKSSNCSVERRTETIWVATVEFSVWCGCKSLILFPVLIILLPQYLILIFKVTVMIALEKVWMLVFIYFFPCMFLAAMTASKKPDPTNFATWKLRKTHTHIHVLSSRIS